jgi:hypothetical protein
MKSERQKREEEIERLMRETQRTPERDALFQEAVRKAAAAVIEQQTSKIQKTERAASRKPLIRSVTAGVAVLLIGAALASFIPGLGATLIICGAALIAWGSFGTPSKNKTRPWWRRLIDRDKSFLTRR